VRTDARYLQDNFANIRSGFRKTRCAYICTPCPFTICSMTFLVYLGQCFCSICLPCAYLHLYTLLEHRILCKPFASSHLPNITSSSHPHSPTIYPPSASFRTIASKWFSLRVALLPCTESQPRCSSDSDAARLLYAYSVPSYAILWTSRRCVLFVQLGPVAEARNGTE